MSDEEDIFEQALRIRDPQERRAFLDRACADRRQLRQQVEGLLQADEQTSGILESPVVQVIDAAASEQPGALVGNFKLLEQIGEGGMGVVYMAEQLRPVKRRVALKILKPGLDTRQVIARFEAERQALAMMDHPNIARVFDAGVTETGRPYFAMELVRGIPITQFCDQHRLTPRQRLELFVQVCQAVQHAHHKGIIHRDLKPTNALVTLADDGKPVSKIIDFGIAKATGGQRLVDQTLFTEFRQLIGTPLYMSPEQAERSALQDVDTRSDVYSLGVLLYELLTGTTPFDKNRLATAAYDEVRRIIREEEPPRPSTRLSTLGATITAISAQRQTDPRKLSQTVRGELDWIVMKALEKDRGRRYETANGLARDVERYLADEPVEAGPPSRVYRLRKLVRRHKSQAIVVSAIAASLILGIIGTSIGLARAKTNLGAARAAEKRERDAKDVATGNEIKAREAETREKTARLEAQKESYFSKVTLGNYYAENGSLAQATQELLECASYPDKSWEWGRLALLCNRTPLSVSCPEALSAERSRDGRLLLISEKSGAIRVYELGRHEPLWRAPSGSVGEKGLYAHFNSDGKYVFSLSGERRIEILDSLTGRVLRKIDAYDGEIVNWSTSTNPRWIFCFTHSPTNCLVFDLETGNLVFQVPLRIEGPSWTYWREDRVMTWYHDTVKVWDVATGTELCTAGIPLPDTFDHFGKTIRLDVHNLRILYRTAQGTMKVWDLRTGKELPWLGHNGITEAWFIAGGPILTLSDDHTARVWEAETGRLMMQRAGVYGLVAQDSSGKFLMRLQNGSREIWSPEGRVTSLNATSQGQALSSAGFDDAGHFITISLNGTVTIWSFEPGRELMTHGSGAISIARSADGTLIATGGSDHRIKLWEACSGRLLANLDGHWTRINSLAFSEDGELLASGGEDGLLNIWDVRGRRERLSIRAEGGAIHGIAFGSGRRVATTSGATVIIWDADSGRKIQELLADEAAAWSVAFSRDGSLLAVAGNDGIITIWDSSGRRVKSLLGHVRATIDVSFSADGKRLVSGGEDGTARVWDVASGTLLHKLSAPGMATSVAFSPDGRRIAATADGAVQLWDADSGRALMSLPPPPGVLFTTAVFSKDGSTLAAGGSDGKLRLWETFPWGQSAYASPASAPLDMRLREYADGYWKDRVTAESAANAPAAADAPLDLPRSLWPRRDPEATPELIDLTNYYNAPLNVEWREAVSDLLELPPGIQTLGGERFDVRGVIQLAGAQQKTGEVYPNHIDGVRVGLRAQRLHLLHAAAVAVADGEQVGSCVLHYADGSTSQLPIRFGREVDLVNAPTYPPSQVVQAWVAGDKHLYRGTWDNPSPEKVIASIDFRSQGAAAPLVVAVSVELPKADLEARVEELKQRRGEWSALIQRARALAQLDRLDEAAADYREALAARPSDGPTRRELVELLLATNQTDQAAKQLAPSPGNPPDLWESQWYVLSPILDKMAAPMPLIPEANTNLLEPQSIGGKSLRWRPTGRYTPVLDLRNWVMPQDHVTAYVQKRIFSQRDRQAVLTTFLDDGGVVWWNGEPIEQRFVFFDWTASRLPIRLRAGWNTLIGRVFNGIKEYTIETTLSLDKPELSLPYQLRGLNGEGSCFSIDFLQGRPEQADALETRAIRYCRANRYTEAAVGFDRYLRMRPGDWSAWCVDAELHLLTGDVDGYRRARHEMIGRFGDVAHWRICRLVAETCLLRPENDADQVKAIEMATRPLAPAEIREDKLSSQITRGLGKLRAGQGSEAAQVLGELFYAELSDYGKSRHGLWLAIALKQSGREAEGLRVAIKAIDIVQKKQDPAAPESDDIISYLQLFVTRQEVENLFGKQALADARATQFQEDMQKQIDRKTVTLSSTARDGQRWADRGNLYARAGLFRQAADDFARAVEISPDNHRYWHDGLVPLLLELGDTESFHRRLKQELDQFRATKDWLTAHRVSKDAFMVPVDGDELTVAVDLANRALTLPNSSRATACQNKGMAEYRSRHYEAAIRWLAEARFGTPTTSRVEDLLFTAMCCERLGDHKQARLLLRQAIQTMETTVPRPGEADYVRFPDIILCKTVRREAEELINGKSGSTSDAPAPIPSATQPTALLSTTQPSTDAAVSAPDLASGK